MLTRTAFALLLTLAGVGETQAAGRIYCAVDDAYIKMSLESGFDAAGGNKLIHFRGALTLKDSKVPGLIETMLLNSGMLRQRWMDGKDLRLLVYSETSGAGPFAALELTIETSATASDPNRFEGRYAVVIETAEKKTSTPRSTAMSREGNLVCEIK